MKTILASMALVFSLLLLPMPLLALEERWGDFSLNVTNKLSAGAAWRIESRDPDLVALANGGNAFSSNGDDGNLAFDDGDLVSAALKLTSDISLDYKDFGLFVRASGLYNPLLNQKDDFFDRGDYGPGKEADAGFDVFDSKTHDVRHQVGRKIDLLDAYGYGNFDIAGSDFSFKLGRQALNWGESAFVLNGLNSLQALDVNRLRVPGFELEELARPSGMAWLSLAAIPGLTIDAFYQFEWRPTLIDVSGTFLSTNDFAGIAGNQANLGFGRVNENSPAGTICTDGSNCVPVGSTVPRGATREASDNGQYGGAVRVLVPWLNDMDLAFYGANYHSRLPVFSGTSRSGPGLTPADTANYFVEYPEDIGLYGLSFNTTVPFDLALQGEYSLKVGQPLQIDDVELLLAGLGAASQINPTPGATLGNQYIQGFRRFDVSQYDLSVTRVLGPWLAYDQLTLLAEVGFVQVHGLPDAQELAFEAPATYTLNAGTAAQNPATAAGLPVVPYDDYATAFSWGYRLAARFIYNNVFNVVNVEPTLIYFHDVDGTTPSPIVNFVEGRQQVTAQLGISYLSNWNLGVGYTTYFGAGQRNLVNDRDFIDATLKYSF